MINKNQQKRRGNIIKALNKKKSLICVNYRLAEHYYTSTMSIKMKP